MRLIEYHPDHLRDLMAGDLNDGAPENIGYMVDFAEQLHQPGWSFSIIHNGQLVLCCGVVDMWPGVGEGWFIASSYLHECKFPLIRIARKKMREVIETNDLWRLQCVVKTGWPAALRFAQHMGFEEEGIMKQYGPERGDYYRMAWVR